MITHQIVKHKPRLRLPEIVTAHLPVVIPGAHVPPIRNNSGVCVFLGKQEYAAMLSKLRLKKGGFCFFKVGMCYPVQDDQIWKIVDINEIHYMDNGNTLTAKAPTPYYLKNKKGEERWANDEMLIGYSSKDCDW